MKNICDDVEKDTNESHYQWKLFLLCSMENPPANRRPTTAFRETNKIKRANKFTFSGFRLHLVPLYERICGFVSWNIVVAAQTAGNSPKMLKALRKLKFRKSLRVEQIFCVDYAPFSGFDVSMTNSWRCLHEWWNIIWIFHREKSASYVE